MKKLLVEIEELVLKHIGNSTEGAGLRHCENYSARLYRPHPVILKPIFKLIEIQIE